MCRTTTSPMYTTVKIKTDVGETLNLLACDDLGNGCPATPELLPIIRL